MRVWAISRVSAAGCSRDSQLKSAVYFVDSSALIAAWIERYPEELFPGVWRFIDGLDGRLRVCEEVRTEVGRHAAGLLGWLDDSSVDSQLSLPALGEDMAGMVQRHLSRISSGWPTWRAIRSGASADPWVIAYSLAFRGVVVSEEQPHGVRSPNVCSALGVPHTNLLGLFRAEGLGGV